MTLAGKQPYLFPYIGFWQTIYACDTFVLADTMQYKKQSYITRNSILLQGKAHQFVLQTYNKKNGVCINEVLVGENAKIILKTIRHTYRRAPYFKDIYPIIQDILLSKEKELARYLAYSIREIATYLDIDTNIIFLSDFYDKETKENAEERVIDICQTLRTDIFIDTIGAQKLYNKDKFLQAGLKLLFLKPEIITYKQFNEKFIPNLSIIDVLMFNGKTGTQELLSRYTLN